MTVTITNNTDTDIENANFYDTISDGAMFTTGTLKINDEPRVDLDPETGFNLPSAIEKNGGTVTVSYKITIDENPTVSSVTNGTTISYKIDEKQYESHSNVVTVKILNNEITLLKEASVRTVKTGDQIDYTITITNNGDYTNTNLTFTDPIPIGTKFVENSVKIDNEVQTGYNPQDGFALGDIESGKSVKVEFSVIVD